MAHQSAQAAAPARPAAPPVPGNGSSYGYNPYLAMSPAPQSAAPRQVPQTSAPPEPRPASAPRQPAFTVPAKLYLRVDDLSCAAYRKAVNLMQIFCEGHTAVIFYDRSTGKYTAPAGYMTVTPFILTRLEALLGKENVVPR